MARILIIEDEAILRRNIVDRLRAEGHELFDASSGETGVELCTLLAPDMVITDLRLPGIDGLEVLRQIKQINERTTVVLVTAHGTQKTAIEALRCGAYDYLNKPVELKELVLLVERAMSHSRALETVEYTREIERKKGGLDQLIGVSRQMQEVKQRLRRLLASPAMSVKEPPTVLITGETGTGKDMIAHAIHNDGPRSTSQFVHVNCTAITETLFESELFGHVRGAFTDAKSTRKGLIEVADGGTLFLDEIGDLSAVLQAKLLVTLETRRIRPVGATNDRPVNVHFIAATNRILPEAVAKGEFRSDLYHRLKVFELHTPALRERPEDIVPLAESFLARQAKRFKRDVPRISDENWAAMVQYKWPGNVRELANTIESEMLACDGTELTLRHLRLPVMENVLDQAATVDAAGILHVDLNSRGLSMNMIRRAVARAMVDLAKGDLRMAAERLDLSPSEINDLLEMDNEGALPTTAEA